MCRYQAQLARKRAAEEMKQVMRELAKTAKLFTQKLAASVKLQVINLVASDNDAI